MKIHRSEPMEGPESLELWGGIECTINRVGEQYFDQISFAQHEARADDIKSFAELGITTLRYPVLWERCLQEAHAPDFRFADRGLNELSLFGVRPVVGLLHHGSGPRHTSLLDPNFAEHLARYARVVTERYPWVGHFTPVNEPLTTARFSCLYGHWYPHERNDRAFVAALLAQCKGTVLAMKAIRELNPAAELVQTEDIGITRSTPELSYQAAFENERRFLTFDLLCGRVNRDHPLFGFLKAAGARERDLAFFRDNPCPPDTIGMNYYVTSERFLDHRTSNFPDEFVGGNRYHAYADVEAVRICPDGLVGPESILRELHARYRLPVAITEVHLGCSVEQQKAWLSYVWQEATRARHAGVKVKAVTLWALLGTYGWDALVTRGASSYEPGVFQIIDGVRESTSLVSFVRSLRAQQEPTPPGWWTHPSRLLYAAAHPPCPRACARELLGVMA